MSFISSYFKTIEDSEPPFEYHAWCMLSTLSVFAGRRFWFPFGPLNYYPNLYVVLVGEPAMRKSTAMSRAKNIVRASGVCPVAATQQSKQSISLEMSHEKFTGRKYFEYNKQTVEYNQYAIFATELTQFIGIDPLGMLDFLTTVWDEAVYEVKTKNKGNDFVRGPYITLCACMTPELVKGFLRQNLLTGGFARRTAFVFSSTKNIVPIPSYTEAQQEAERQCVEFGKMIQHRSGPFDWTEQLKKFYIDWNFENEKTLRERPPTTRGWYQSKAEMLFKVSMLIALSEMDKPDTSLLLDIPHYKAALKFCAYVEQNLERVFEGAGINPNANAAAQICRMLEALDRPMNRKHIEAMFFDQATSLNELRDTITHLISVGRLAEKTITVSNAVMGSVIGTPGSLTRYTDAQLAVFLQRQSAVAPDLRTDSAAATDLIVPLASQPEQSTESVASASQTESPVQPNTAA